MHIQKLNLKGRPIQIIISSTVKVNCSLNINKNDIAIISKRKKKVHLTTLNYLSGSFLLIAITLRAKKEGVLTYRILADGEVLFKSEYLEIPGAGTYKTRQFFETEFKFGDRHAPDRSSKRRVGLVEREEHDLQPIKLLHNDGKTEELEGLTVRVPVFFATARNPVLDKKEQLQDFGNDRGTLNYGIGEVSIPKNKRKGEIPRPKWWKCEWKENQEKHMAVLQLAIKEQDVFFTELKQQLADSASNDVLLFIHGYNESFKSSMLRAAQLAFDINFKGVISVFSWPSAYKVAGYIRDIESVRYTLPYLKQYLLQLKAMVPTGKIHIIAHSMGNEHLTQALDQLKNSFDDGYLFNQLIMAAPDVDVQIFERDIAGHIVNYSTQVTIYASANDWALKTSNLFRWKYQRLGQMGKKPVLFEKIDTVDASEESIDLLGHGYFSETRSVIRDIRKIIKFGHPPLKRKLLMVPLNHLHYWKFKEKEEY